MNRWSTAGFVPPSVYIGFRSFVLLGRRSSDVSSMLWKVRRRLVSWTNNPVGTQSCPTPPRHPALRPDPTRPWYVRVLDLTGASGKTFKRLVLDALEGTGEPCPLDKQFCWYPVLPDPAPPPRRAPRTDLPVVCPSFGFDR